MIRELLRKIRGIGQDPVKSNSDDRVASSPNNSLVAAEKSGYSPDRPISSQEEDRFNRWPFAERISETIAERGRASSLVLAVYGAWGEGKTSVLNLMHRRLEEYEDVTVIRFNPWYFESEDQLIRGFFASLADGLGRGLPTRGEELGTILEKYGSILSIASVSFLGGAAEIRASGLSELGRQVSTVELTELRERLEQILRAVGRKVVVLIDDIDRLDRDEIHALFKLVKHSAGFENSIYVLAFDDEMVAGALGERYGKGGIEAGERFLEKIIQVPLHLPPADAAALRQLVFQGVDRALSLASIELDEDEARTFVRHFTDGFEVRLHTPRQAVRYANALEFALPILRGEVHVIDQMLLEGTRVFYPELYETMRRNRDVFIGEGLARRRSNDAASERARRVVEESLEELNTYEQSSALELLQVLFPRLKGVFQNYVYGSDWEERWEREKRICSKSYFDRYVQYGVPARDVSEREISDLLGAAETDAEALTRLFQELVKRGAASRLIQRLRYEEEDLEGEPAGRLARVVADSAELLPRQEGPFSVFYSPFSQAAVLCMKLCHGIQNMEERVRLCTSIVEETESIQFATECLTWFSNDRDTPEEERLLSAEDEQRVASRLVERIRSSAAVSPLYSAHPTATATLLAMWSEYGNLDDVQSHLRSRLQEHPTEVGDLLSCFASQGWSMETGLPVEGELRRRAYDRLTQFVEAETIVEAIEEAFDVSEQEAQFRPQGEVSYEERLANQFLVIHERVLGQE